MTAANYEAVTEGTTLKEVTALLGRRRMKEVDSTNGVITREWINVDGSKIVVIQFRDDKVIGKWRRGAAFLR